YACEQGHTETIVAMIPYLDHETIGDILCLACAYSKPEVVREILENTDVSANTEIYGETALYIATTACSLNCVKLLLARNADVHVKSLYQPDKSRYLIRHGIGTKTPKTPLQGLVSTYFGAKQALMEPILKTL